MVSNYQQKGKQNHLVCEILSYMYLPPINPFVERNRK